MKRLPVYLLLLVLGSACSSGEDKGKLLAKVGEAELYQTDLNYLFRNREMSSQDSAALLKVKVDEWVEEQILVQEASKDATVDVEDAEARAERFKNELIIHQLMESRVDEGLDTVVTMVEIKKYYKSHEEEFQLNDYLVKVLYMKVPFDAPDIDKISSAYKLRRDSDIEDLLIYAPIYAANFYYDEENWIYFDDLLKEIPLTDIKKDRFIMKRSKIRFEEAGHYYFLNIIDYKLKNTLSPIEFEVDNIRNRILNKRVSELRESIKNDIIKSAHEKGDVEIY